jgi:hypothetical protein
VAGIGLAEIFGALGEQPTRKSTRPKSRSLSWASQDRTSGSTSTSYSPAMHLMLYAFAAMANSWVRCQWPQDPQAEQAEHGHKGEVAGMSGLAGGGEQRLELQVGEPKGR